MALAKIQTSLVIGLGLLLVSGIIVVPQLESNGNTSAFTLSGHFEDVFAGRHNKAGDFVVKASGTKALVEVISENGYREITGTDGRDAYAYIGGAACISSGIFPTNYLVSFENQLLWLISVRDLDSLAQLKQIRFYFYKDYSPEEITILTQTNGTAPGLASIRWYAPNYIHYLQGDRTKRHESASYPKGSLIAEVKISETQLIAGRVLPKEIVFTQFQHHFSSNTQPIADQNQIPKYEPEDVVPVEVDTYSITNAQIGKPLPSYLPVISEDSVQVHDLRISNNKQVWIKSRKWYDLATESGMTNQIGDFVFDASGKLRLMTMKDLQELQRR